MAPLNDKYNLHYSKDTYRTQTLIKIKHIVTAIRTSLIGKSMLFKAWISEKKEGWAKCSGLYWRFAPRLHFVEGPALKVWSTLISFLGKEQLTRNIHKSKSRLSIEQEQVWWTQASIANTKCQSWIPFCGRPRFESLTHLNLFSRERTTDQEYSQVKA